MYYIINRKKQVKQKERKYNMQTKKVIFYGIDSWNRPIFKAVGEKKFFGSTDKLFGYSAKIEEVLKEVTNKDLLYFGDEFDCEPCGSKCQVEIIKGD